MTPRNVSEAGSPIADIRFEERRILVVLEDGRALAAPLGWAGPTVTAMDAEGRSAWVRTDDGRGVNWPAAGQRSEEGALNVWNLEQDALFEEALGELKAADGNADALSTSSRELVSLWRLIADGYNGGLLQFLGNWGIGEVHAALAALDVVNATATHGVVSSFWALVGPIAESDAVATMEDVYAGISDELSDRLTELDHQLWEVAEELVQVVPRTYGPARSVWEVVAE